MNGLAKDIDAYVIVAFLTNAPFVVAAASGKQLGASEDVFVLRERMQSFWLPSILSEELEATRFAKLLTLAQFACPIPSANLILVSGKRQECVGHPSAFSCSAHDEEFVPRTEEFACQGLGIDVDGYAIDIFRERHSPKTCQRVASNGNGERHWAGNGIGIFVGGLEVANAAGRRKFFVAETQCASFDKTTRVFELIVREGRQFLNASRHSRAYSPDVGHVLSK